MVKIMEDELWNVASLRISSNILSAVEITNIIGLSPTSFRVKGELMSKRNPKSQKHGLNLWILDSGLPDCNDIEEHLKKLGSLIESKIFELQSLEDKCEMDIFCGITLKGGQNTLLLTSEIIKKISLIPLDLVFDIYTNNE